MLGVISHVADTTSLYSVDSTQSMSPTWLKGRALVCGVVENLGCMNRMLCLAVLNGWRITFERYGFDPRRGSFFCESVYSCCVLRSVVVLVLRLTYSLRKEPGGGEIYHT